MNITPSPRILRMLGEIEFDEWQCIAELVDNAFDDFTEIVRSGQSWPGGFKVVVTVPSRAAGLVGAEIVVQDTGQGMTRSTLEQAVRAGWSGNDRFDKLGLFGMGFNVSTARLGRRTRVLTTRPGDPEWTGVEIDLDRLGSDFEALDISKPKDDLSEHGTRIEITNLIHDRADWLSRHAAGLRTTLGRVYGWLLDNNQFELWVQGVKVTPRRACRWGDDRFVMFGNAPHAEKIPAYIKVDKKFEPADACELCGNWQNPGKDACDQCGSHQLLQRERHLHGWLGVQRHLDKQDYGIDFLRNGRKILQYDKRLFTWTNPSDPAAGVDVEYPVELAHQGGRLIGEIHLDHVPVHYAKNAFEYSDRAWKGAVDYLRGEAPLQPQKAVAAGYRAENTSPLARLFKGYRRNDAGTRCLIPGNGSGPLHEETRQWARKFWAGDPDYQTDQKWWDQVVAHDERQKQAKLGKATGDSSGGVDDAAVRDAIGEGQLTITSSPPSVAPTTQDAPVPASRTETVQERLTRYIAGSSVQPELSREFGLSGLGTIKIQTRVMAEPVQDADGHDTPIWLAPGPGGTATALIALNHDAFTKLGLEPAELLLTELSATLKVKANSPFTHSQISAKLRAECLPDTAVNHVVIRTQAGELLADVRQRMAENVGDDLQRSLSYLDSDEQTFTENALIADGGDSMAATLGGSGRFLLYVPPLFLVKLLENWPEAFMEGRVFVGSYTSLSSQSSKRLSLARIVGYLNDVATLMTFQLPPSVTQLRRTRLSVELLQQELAPDQA